MEKTPEVEELIKRAIGENPLLAGLAMELMVNVALTFAELREVSAGDVVIQEGDEGKDFFIVESGTFTVSKGGSAAAPLPVSSFGELALLFNAPRAATVAAATAGRLWALDRATFRFGVRTAASVRRKQVLAALSKVELLSPLSPAQLDALADNAKEVAFTQDQVVFKKGDAGDVFFVIFAGEFSFDLSTAQSLTTASGKEVVVPKKPVVKSAGDFFGERALLTGDPRAATVTCKSPAATCMALSREDFESAVGAPLKQLVEMHEHRAVLAKMPLLKNLGEVERVNAVRRFEVAQFEAGAAIVTEGEPGDRFFVLSEGTVTVTKRADPSFKKQLGAGEFFGEGALLDHADTRSATVTADGPVRCFSLSREAFGECIVGGTSELVRATAAERAAKARSQHQLDLELTQLDTLAVLGAGTFGRVSLVQDQKKPGSVYALKALHKSEVS